MFQRIRGAIDRSLAEAEELARQRAVSPGGAGPRTSSTARRSSRTANPATEGGPDPAVFEAAFVIDESEAPSRVSTPKVGAEGDQDNQPTGEGTGADSANHSQTEKDLSRTSKDGQPAKAGENGLAADPELPPDIKVKLRKLGKLEATYPELLRSYRIAHSRVTSIEPFERALKENTPLTSIKDPAALVEYLNQLNLKTTMVMDELKRVSTEKDELSKKVQAQDVELVALKAKASADISAAGGDESAPSGKRESSQQGDDGQGSPAQDGQDFFSYENEVPKAHADVAAKDEEISKLKSEIASLTSDLAIAKEASEGLDRLRDAAVDQDKLKAQLEARASEIATLTGRLKEVRSQLEDEQKKFREEQEAGSVRTKGLRAKLDESMLKASDLDLKLGKAALAKTGLEKKVNDLIEQLEQEKADSQDRIAKLTDQVRAATSLASSNERRATSPAPSLAPSLAPSTVPSTAGGNKKKNRKKKKGGANAATAAHAPPAASDQVEAEETEFPSAPSSAETVNVAALEAEIARLKEDIVEKDRQIDRLSRKRKTEDDLREEIEDLQDNLLTIGQSHVEAKERIKGLETEKKELHARIDELQRQLEEAPANSAASEELQKEFDAMKQEFDDLKQKTQTLQTDLGAAEQLAQTRLKDLSDLRSALDKVQLELKSLRQDTATLKTTREELAARDAELRTLERKEKDLQSQLAWAQQSNKTFEEKLKAESLNRMKLDEVQRTHARELRRGEAEKIELSAREERATRELQRVQDEAGKLRPRVRELEVELEKLRRERKTVAEDAEYKTKQYTDAQSLLATMRVQSAEMSLQLKEARSQAEALEEELGEVQKLLRERSHEGETMRRMLAEVDERADVKVREMQTRLDAAIEERDRAEDEANTRARRGMRDTEELRNKVRDLERDIKALQSEKSEFEERERDWHKRRDSLEAADDRARSELAEARAAVDGLGKTLDESEARVREAEQQRADLRRVLDEQRGRYEKLSKELKTYQLRLGLGGGGNGGGSGSGLGGSSRSSGESTRTGSAHGGGGAADVSYIKTVLLQFLVQKDAKLRLQLVPVLGKLLHFDKADEQMWASAVQHLEVK